jgi:hypothetical protein
MKSPVESISLDGMEMRLVLRSPIPADGKALAAAAAVRILERYPVIQTVVSVWGHAQFEVTREEVERLLRPDGLAALADRARWQDLINKLTLSQRERVVLQPKAAKPGEGSFAP